MVFGLSLAVGKVHAGLRYELEYTWRYRFDLNANGSAYYPKFSNDVQTDTIMLNVYKDFNVWKSIKPYVGVGMGYVHNRNQASLLVLSGGGETRIDDTQTTDGFSWSLGAGFTRPFSENWLLDVSYRYIDLGEIEAGPFSGGFSNTTLESSKYYSHEFRVGFRHEF